VAFTGETEKAAPLQTEETIAVIAGLGLTVMLTVWVAPKQPPTVLVGVTS
jgi:hypothetical protein